MKIRDWIFEPLVALLLCAMLIPDAGAQTGPYTKFGPVTGIMKGNAASPITTLAVSTDISTLFCSSSSTNFLRADGTCAVPSGSVPTGAANLVYATPNGSTGAATLRSIVLADLPLINVVGGGTGLGTLTAHGVLLGEGTSNVTPLVMGADTVLRGTASADPVATAVNNCGSATTALSYSTSTHTFGCQTITSGGTGTVTSVTAGTGLTASPNPIISTGTVSLDLTASNTWTGNESFSGSTLPVTVNAPTSGNVFSATGSRNGAITSFFINGNAGTSAISIADVSGNGGDLVVGMQGSAFNSGVGTGGFFTGSPAAQAAVIGTSTGSVAPLTFGTQGVARMLMTATGSQISGYGPTAAGLVDMTPDSGTFTGVLTGLTASVNASVSWVRQGSIVVMTISGTGTSNSTSLTMTGLPSNLQPATLRQLIPCNVEDAGANTSGLADVPAGSGTITFYRITVATGAWNATGYTATGTKGLNLTSFTYTLK